jgi:twinkle protein
MSESTVIKHIPCEACGSSDANTLYDDNHEFCFAQGCGAYIHGSDGSDSPEGSSALIAGGYPPLPSRKLSEETLRFFDYRVNSPAHYATFYSKDGKAVAQKKRSANKQFCWVGEPETAVLFGQQKFKEGGRKVVVCEGELDAMSMSQVQGHKWPVVSIRDGAAGALKSIKGSLEWLSSFDEIILQFDNDEPGRLAAIECAEILPPGKAFISTLPLSDANEMLVKGRVKELINSVWHAQPYRPDGIVSGSMLWERIQEAEPIREADYPYQELDRTLHGMRKAEIVTFCAGTGIGKSTICREIAYSLIQQGEKVGYVALEESVKRTALSLMSIHLNRPLHLEPMDVEDPEFKDAYKATVGEDQVALYDHFGSTDSDNLLSKIRYMVVGLGCNFIVLDHISIVVSGTESREGERVLLDRAMTRLASLAREVNCNLMIICHLRKAPGNGKSFEEGAQISLSDLRGTAGISQLSDAVVAVERNQQDHGEEGLTTLRVLKNRFSGVTGEAGQLTYNFTTGRLLEHDPFKDEASESESASEF